MKENKGITLIALIITIIVLLILAGVSIAMLSGDNGVLNQNSRTIAYNVIVEVSDDISMTVNKYVSSYYEATYKGEEYVGEADEVNSIEDAISDAIIKIQTDYATNDSIEIEYTSSSVIKIIYDKYSKTGNIDTTTGAINWGSIVQE